jgi:hypothetical protein
LLFEVFLRHYYKTGLDNYGIISTSGDLTAGNIMEKNFDRRLATSQNTGGF